MSFCYFSSEYKKVSTINIDSSFIYNYLPESDGTAVKIYIAGLLACQNSADIDAIKFAEELHVTIDELYDSFVYWEQLDLVKIISKSPLVVSYLPIPKLINKPKKYSPEKYSDFTKTLQTLLPERMISVSEYSNYFSIMEENNIKPDALILIIKYCIDLKGENVGYRYIIKVINDFIFRGLTSFEAIDNEFSSYVMQSSEVGNIITALKLKRRPEIEDVKLYEKWTKNYGFTLNSILIAVTKLKKKTIEKLDDFLTELFNYKLFTEQEIEQYIFTKEYLYDLTLKINKTLSVYYEVLEPEIDNYVSVWNSYGFTEQSLLFLATYCFKSNKRTLADLDLLVKKLYTNGTISFDSIIQFFEEINAQNEFILKLFKELSISRNVVDWDRERLATWKEWGFSDEMILLACSQSSGKNSPFSYVNTILSNWKNNNIFSPEKVKPIANQTTQTRFENEREYNQDYFDSLITKVANTKL